MATVLGPNSIPATFLAAKQKTICVIGILLISIVSLAGCNLPTRQLGKLPNELSFERGQLIVHSDFPIPNRHRLVNELVDRRLQLAKMLKLPISDKPIDVYLFETESEFRAFVNRNHPDFPDRRALFVKKADSLSVLTYWGERVAEDLRHEVTHGYLHSVVPDIPLWIDEGLAEYFEVSDARSGFNAPHIYLLATQIRRGEWVPDLERLASINDPKSLSQTDYAEAWLWTHFMLNHSESTRTFLVDFVRQIREGETPMVFHELENLIPMMDEELVAHLGILAKSL